MANEHMLKTLESKLDITKKLKELDKTGVPSGKYRLPHNQPTLPFDSLVGDPVYFRDHNFIV